MNRAFVKEQDNDAADVLPDLPLSPHPNYVTARGLNILRERLATLLRRRVELESDAVIDPAALVHLKREQRWLEARVANAISVDLAAQPRDRVAFGATVDIAEENGKVETYTIVGEDEADAEHCRVSWLSPLAKALLGAHIGDEVRWQRPAGDRTVEVQAIRYTG